LCFADGVAFVNGSAVLPAFRRRGAQGALIRARLERARALGFAVACSNTQPGTASRRNLERHGFSVAYPKVVMVVDD
jgi:ribosomal protein S18 acetylase RimI-like enzyme